MHGARRRQRGFTLLEILVALAILVVGMSALVKAAIGNASNATYLKQKTFAQWVAVNKVNEMRIQHSWPSTGSQTGRVFFAEIEWSWKVKTSNTQDKDIRRIEVSVKQESQTDGEPLATVTAFLGRSS